MLYVPLSYIYNYSLKVYFLNKILRLAQSCYGKWVKYKFVTNRCGRKLF